MPNDNSTETDNGSARLLLVRHGESTWNARALWQGQANPPLSTRGEGQSRLAAKALAGLGLRRVISSDLVRASTTGQIIAAHLALGSVIVDEGFREVDVGEWSGLTRIQIEQRWPGFRAAWAENKLESTPGGELLSSFTERVIAAVDRAAALAAAGPVLVIGHSRVLSALERVVGIQPARPTHLSGRWFSSNGGGKLTGGSAVDLLGQVWEPTRSY